jgi:hypothetical protein
MKSLFITAVVVLCTAPAVFAQWGEEGLGEKPKWQQRVFTGGGLGASFGSYYDYISVSPLIGYRLTERLATGISVQYRDTNYNLYTPEVSTNDWGVSPFLRFQVFGPIFLHAEYEYLNYQYVYAGEKFRQGFNSFMAGAGFFQPLGRRAGFYAVALYNFSYKDPTPNTFSPYTNPLVLRVGITAGF